MLLKQCIMTQGRILLTKQGFNGLDSKLQYMIERRVVVLQEKEVAKEKGDLSENGDYQEALNEQNLLDIEIRKYKSILGTAEVIDVANMTGDKVTFGATVTMLDMETDNEICYQIVSEYESDLESGLLSITSPIGRQTINKAVGDIIQVDTPRGSKTYKIILIEFK
ncbi:MAG: transcription elongation factor [Candidatus Xenolissoclinum pacificiensis L6]|uniref:Transcription elongation factor GreA n=1 Tax=Candidatus Xenolissoclinum pacificiensis L6 TaxID=1401685 RepID=W2V071_9RICK|nr:MAG: transcription elongation factor [Candidatus Xenolissoclinum pacificiensis L6]